MEEFIIFNIQNKFLNCIISCDGFCAATETDLHNHRMQMSSQTYVIISGRLWLMSRTDVTKVMVIF